MKLLLEPNQVPARLNSDQVAVLLGMHPADIPVLVRGKFLRPLGTPPPNGTKFFAASLILRLAEDERWLARASDAIVAHHHERNHGGEE